MYIKVRLLIGWKESLIYKVPESWHYTESKDLIGTLVKVPFQKRVLYALVEDTTTLLTDQQLRYTIRDALSQVSCANNSFYRKFIQQLSAYYGVEERVFYKRICTSLQDQAEAEYRENSTGQSTNFDNQNFDSKNATTIQLTDEQQNIVTTIIPSIKNSEFKPHVIQGVTGSGKTEIYAALIAQAYQENRVSLLLLPEVSLALQFISFFKKRFESEFPILGYHSATSVQEKRVLWEHIYQQKPFLLIGVHLPILLPLSKLGLIIIDEEHECGYQEKQHPKVNTKEAALLRASIEKIPLVLGSATPSISTLYNIQDKNWKLSTLTKRFKGAFPKIEIIPYKKDEKRPHFWLSKQLLDAIQTRLEKKEQVLIFLNRRGYSFFVQCISCGFIFNCNACSVSLTFHEPDKLICHYCGKEKVLPTSCNSCKSTKLLKKGIGTQQVVSLLQGFFPAARIERADLDSTVNKKKWQKTIALFSENKLDILVGTQTITKGYHFPQVTLVGILWADMHLGFPMYNATETTIQQLIQVAGRAGRQHPDSLVVIQTMIDHQVLKYVDETNYNNFFTYELEKRRSLQYPPFVRFAEIELRHPQEDIIERESEQVFDVLYNYVYQNKLQTVLLGPSQPLMHKIKNTHVRKIYLKGQTVQELIRMYAALDKTVFECSIFFTPNPLSP